MILYLLLLGHYNNKLCPVHRIDHMKLAPYQNYYRFTNTYNYDRADEYDKIEILTKESKYMMLTIPERPRTLVTDIYEWINSDEMKPFNLTINQYGIDLPKNGPYSIVD